MLLPLLLFLLPLATAVILLLTRDASFRNSKARERLGSGDDGARTCRCRHLL